MGREWGSIAVRWGVSGAAQVCGGPVAVRGGSRGRKATEGKEISRPRAVRGVEESEAPLIRGDDLLEGGGGSGGGVEGRATETESR